MIRDTSIPHKKNKMMIMLTGRMCNLSCAYCYARHDHAGQKPKEVTDFLALDKAMGDRDWEDTEIEYWGGEPLFNPNLKRTVQHFKELGVRRQGFVTNGTLITDEVAAWLSDNDMWVNISNDLAYQKETRGYQILEDDSRQDALIRLCEENRLHAFQTVCSTSSPNVMRQYEYLTNWAAKAGIDEKHTPRLVVFACKSYSPLEDYLLFRKGEAVTEEMQEAMYNLTLKTFEGAGKDKVLGSMFRTRIQAAYEDLIGEGKSVPCLAFQERSYDLEGHEWSCPHDFEVDPEHPRVFPSEPEPDEHCDGCALQSLCGKVCAGAEVWHSGVRKRSCESLYLTYAPILGAIWDCSTEEQRRKYAVRPDGDGRWVNND